MNHSLPYQLQSSRACRGVSESDRRGTTGRWREGERWGGWRREQDTQEMKMQATVACGERKGDDGEGGVRRSGGENQKHMWAKSPVLFPTGTSWLLLAHPSK